VSDEASDSAEDLAVRRQATLSQMQDDDVHAEAVSFAVATWQRPGRLERHARKHGRQVSRALGKPIDTEEYDAVRRTIVSSPDRVFTGITRTGSVEYQFIGSVGNGAIIVIVRDGFVRTMLRARSLRVWRSRHPAIEVTGRVRLPLL
jgi:hypothetical protein